MGTYASGIWNQLPAAQELNALRPAAAATTNATIADVGSEGASISANDFLTLLVTEMQNQDPTAQTDPNEYVNQLVQVNSLEQLISINQTLQTGLGVTSSQAAHSNPEVSSAGLPVTPVAKAATSNGAVTPATVSIATGNLTLPLANPAADQVAKALATTVAR